MSALRDSLAQFQRADVLTLIRVLEQLAKVTPTCERERRDIRTLKSTTIQLAMFAKILEK